MPRFPTHFLFTLTTTSSSSPPPAAKIKVFSPTFKDDFVLQDDISRGEGNLTNVTNRCFKRWMELRRKPESLTQSWGYCARLRPLVTVRGHRAVSANCVCPAPAYVCALFSEMSMKKMDSVSRTGDCLCKIYWQPHCLHGVFAHARGNRKSDHRLVAMKLYLYFA